MSMTAKLDRMVTYLEGLVTIKSHNTLITWSCKVTWQENQYISTTNVLMATKLGKMMTYFERLLTIKSFYALITWSSKVTLQTKIIIYPQPECLSLQNWQNENLTYKVTSPFDHMVLQDHVQTKTILSPLPLSLTTKLARMMIYLDRLLIIKSYKALITWSCKVTWQTEIIISLLQKCLWQTN